MYLLAGGEMFIYSERFLLNRMSSRKQNADNIRNYVIPGGPGENHALSTEYTIFNLFFPPNSFNPLGEIIHNTIDEDHLYLINLQRGFDLLKNYRVPRVSNLPSLSYDFDGEHNTVNADYFHRTA